MDLRTSIKKARAVAVLECKNALKGKGWFFTPEGTFAALFLIFGVLFMVAIPPLQIADEGDHFYRAYQVSEGTLSSSLVRGGSGGTLPAGTVEFVRQVDKHKLGEPPAADQKIYPRKNYPKLWSIRNSDQRTNVGFSNTAIYAPVNYVVPAAAIKVTSLFDRPLLQFFAARIVNFVFLGIAMIVAIKWLPKGKWALVAIGLLPMVLYEAISISADVYILGVVALFISYWYKLYAEKSVEITKRSWIILGTLAVLLALSKPSYVAFVPIILLLVWQKKGPDFRKQLAIAVVIMATALGAALGWAAASSNAREGYNQWSTAMGTQANPELQMDVLTSQPQIFLQALGNTFFTNNGNGLVTWFLGAFGWLDTPLPLLLCLGVFAVLLLAFGLDRAPKKEASLNGIFTLTFFGLAILSIVILAAGVYLYWSPVKSPLVIGLQGRYFIPTLIFLLPVMVGKYRHTISQKTIFLLLSFILFSTVLVLSYRYYTLPSLLT